MNFKVDTTDGVTIIEVPADSLDVGNSTEFKQEVSKLLDGRSQVLLDLGKLRFVDSSGLGALLSCLRQLKAQGGEMKLCALSRTVQALFELVRSHRIFDILESREAAVQQFNETP